MKKCILDMRVVENLRLHKNYCLLKLTPDGQTLPEMRPGYCYTQDTEGKKILRLREQSGM